MYLHQLLNPSRPSQASSQQTLFEQVDEETE
jgi:hypothetical protein